MSDETRLLLGVACNSAIIYIFLIVSVRMAGRRHLGQLTSLDLLILILLGSAVETAMVRANTSLRAGLVSGATLLIINRLLAWGMLKSPRFRHLVGSGPLLLVYEGRFVDENMKRLGMSKEDVIEAIRERGCGSIKDLRFAVFEPDGEINVVFNDS